MFYFNSNAQMFNTHAEVKWLESILRDLVLEVGYILFDLKELIVLTEYP